MAALREVKYKICQHLVSSSHGLTLSKPHPTENYFRSILSMRILFPSSKRSVLLLHTKTERFILIQTLPPHTSHPKYLDLLAKMNECVTSHKNNQLNRGPPRKPSLQKYGTNAYNCADGYAGATCPLRQRTIMLM